LIEMIRRAPGPDSLAGLVDLVDHVVRHLAITKPGQRSGVAGQDERIAVAEARPIVMLQGVATRSPVTPLPENLVVPVDIAKRFVAELCRAAGDDSGCTAHR
jgi:hypothetical protein